MSPSLFLVGEDGLFIYREESQNGILGNDKGVNI
jgi:hypothetical protein